jgi:prevent-host-death family protein
MALFLLHRAPPPARIDHLDSQESAMKRVSVAEAKAKLSEILEGVIAGDEVIITRRGKEIARLGGMEAPKDTFDFDALKARVMSMPEYHGNSVVEMREGDRY